MLVLLARSTLSVLALLLIWLGPAALPARAQVLPRPVILKLIRERTKQAFAVEAEIQKTQKILVQVQVIAPFAVPNVQTILSQEQAVLAQIQAQINLLTQLLANIDAAFAVNDLIQKTQKQIDRLQRSKKGSGKQVEIAALQVLVAALQAELAQIQANINTLQAQIVI